jgi:hypothetical protein
MGTMISNTGAAWSTAVTKWRRKFFHQVSVTGVFLLLACHSEKKSVPLYLHGVSHECQNDLSPPCAAGIKSQSAK